MTLPWTPTPSEVRNKQPHHRDCRPTCCFVRRPLVLILGKNHGYSDVANAHCDGSQCQYWLSSELVNVQDGWNGGEEHDDAHNACGKKGSCV